MQHICRASRASLTVERGLKAFLEVIQSPLGLFAAAKICNLLRWFGHTVCDAKKNCSQGSAVEKALTGYKVPHEADAVL